MSNDRLTRAFFLMMLSASFCSTAKETSAATNPTTSSGQGGNKGVVSGTANEGDPVGTPQDIQVNDPRVFSQLGNADEQKAKLRLVRKYNDQMTAFVELLKKGPGKGQQDIKAQAEAIFSQQGAYGKPDPQEKRALMDIAGAFIDIYAGGGRKPEENPRPEPTNQNPSQSQGTPGGRIPTNGPQPSPGGTPNPDPVWNLQQQMNRGDLHHHPDNPVVVGNAGLNSYYNGNYQQGFSLTKKAIEGGNTDPNVMVAFGGSAYQLGDHALANEAGKTAMGMDPNNEAAERLYKLSIDKSESVKLPSIGAALSALNQQSFEAATAQANKGGGTNFFGSGGGSAASGGISAAGSGSNMTAAQIAAAAARQSEAPRSSVEQSASITKEAAGDLGVHDYQGAYNLASKAIDLNPRNAQAWNFRAIADNKLNKFSDAVYDASFSLGLVPGNAPALQSRSWAFAKEGKYKEALADANYTLEKEPANSFAFQNRAFALAGMGDKDGALAALRRSAELDPRFKDKLDKAMQAPEESDLLFLFQDEPAAKVSVEGAAAESSPAGRKNRFLRLFVLSIAGGLLVALGLLHVVSASWREKVQSTIRRVIGAAPQAVAEEEAAGAPLTGFWSQYQVLRQIGTGGMGVVYEAKDTTLDRPVAIKKMRDEIRMDPAERQRFVTEARTVAALHHPNIVDIYSIVEDEKDVYLVFEYVDGKTLGDLLRDKGPLDFDAALKILRGACDAVDYAHRQKIIHRDIKSSNIMISDDGRVKVMDFGVARQAKDAMTKMSLTNTIVGTPPYMAPEQEQGTVRKESDVFGLGVVFYELMSGKLPFNGQGAGMLLNKINGRHNPLSQQVAYGLPAGIDAVIAKALAPDPDKRYRTPAEFLAAVEALAGSRS